MQKNIKFWLVFVLCYIFAFFIWWTYSLVKLSKELYGVRLQNEHFAAKEHCKKMHKALHLDTAAVYKQEALKNYAIKHCPDLVLVYNSDGKPDFKVCQAVIRKHDAWLKKEKIKYIAEGLTMFVIIGIGVMWLFISINRILNLSKQQNNFLLSVSHELKTPVTAIKLVAQTLTHNDEKLDKTTKTDLLLKIDQNANRLTDLIDRMLLLTRIEGSQYKKSIESNNLKKLVEDIIRRIPNSLKANFKININIPDNLSVAADRLTLDICLSNLIDNALKYSPVNSTIDIIGAEKQGKKYVKISDQGLGINSNDKKRVFEKFYRVGNEDTRITKGTGLGLYLVKQILKLNKAQIYIKDNTPKGSIFILTFKK